jgi:hypothetical protein
VANPSQAANTASAAAKGAKSANFVLMVAEAGGQLALNAWDSSQRRKLEETLSALSSAEQQKLAEEMARSGNSIAQIQLMLDAYARAREAGLTQRTNQVKNFALILMGLGVLSIGIVLAFRKR